MDHGSAGAIEEIAASLRSNQFAVEVLTPDVAHECWPSMNLNTAIAFCPNGGHVFADRTVYSAASAAVLKLPGARGSGDLLVSFLLPTVPQGVSENVGKVLIDSPIVWVGCSRVDLGKPRGS
ncbi:MAG: hypothetical protein FJW97_05400 [Actinobacteria bacterium]|nr:hypothetical protein [Actinomycetota bacterium]